MRPQYGLGSGIIVDAQNGYIVTNYHVVGGADKIEVVLADNRKFDNEWVRTDPQTDLARKGPFDPWWLASRVQEKAKQGHQALTEG